MSGEKNIFIQGYEVELPSIERELGRFWKEFAAEEDGAVIRATTLNFIYLVAGEDEMERASKLAADIIQHHPARILLVNIDTNSNREQITSYVNAFCQPPQNGGKQICCEQITLQTGRPGIVHLSGAILPLLLPDLPVFLFCPQPAILIQKELSSLLQLVKRVILETSLPCKGFAEAAKKAKLIMKLHQTARVSDISWGSLTLWREGIAQFFDASPPGLYDRLNRVVINTAGTRVGFSAVLFLFWLAGRLGWTFIRAEGNGRILFHNEKGENIPALLVKDKDNPDESEGVLTRISLSFDYQNNGKELLCYLRKNKMIIESKAGQQSTLINTFDNFRTNREKLICDELDFLREDSLFTETLKAIAATAQDGE